MHVAHSFPTLFQLLPGCLGGTESRSSPTLCHFSHSFLRPKLPYEEDAGVPLSRGQQAPHRHAQPPAYVVAISFPSLGSSPLLRPLLETSACTVHCTSLHQHLQSYSNLISPRCSDMQQLILKLAFSAKRPEPKRLSILPSLVRSRGVFLPYTSQNSFRS